MPDTIVQVDWLKSAIDAGSVALFDCGFDLSDPAAGRAAYRAGHLPGARYVHLDDDLSGPITGRNGRHPLPDPAVLAETLRRTGLRRGAQVVAYDAAGGPYAARLWWLLRWLGHDQVAVLDGGKQAWIAAGLPLEVGEVAAAPAGDFEFDKVRGDSTADVREVLAALDADDIVIVDARSAERFRGEPNPLDPVPGHIPGARNRFFKNNLDPDGRFKSPAELAAALDHLLDGTESGNVIHQCGSGVTACHNLLAAEIAGRRVHRLYPGSWGEWISDPSRPVERD